MKFKQLALALKEEEEFVPINNRRYDCKDRKRGILNYSLMHYLIEISKDKIRILKSKFVVTKNHSTVFRQTQILYYAKSVIRLPFTTRVIMCFFFGTESRDLN